MNSYVPRRKHRPTNPDPLGAYSAQGNTLLFCSFHLKIPRLDPVETREHHLGLLQALSPVRGPGENRLLCRAPLGVASSGRMKTLVRDIRGELSSLLSALSAEIHQGPVREEHRADRDGAVRSAEPGAAGTVASPSKVSCSSRSWLHWAPPHSIKWILSSLSPFLEALEEGQWGTKAFAP